MEAFYERLNWSIKNVFRRVVGKAILKETEFVTFLTKVEAQINSQPLSRVTANPEDSDPISPDMIINGRKLSNVTWFKINEFEDTNQVLMSHRPKYRQTLLKHFFNSWKNEYLKELSIGIKWCFPVDNIVKGGDLVLIEKEKVSRLSRPICRVTELTLSRDGRISSVIVICNNWKLRRPLNQVFPLKCELNK
nr:uncharacterized protein LOC121115929 [Lepeophtheirus salmonis]